jgi:hypothetical protein
MYSIIAPAMPRNLKKATNRIVAAIRMYLFSLPFHFKDFTLRENIGISDTNSKDVTMDSATKPRIIAAPRDCGMEIEQHTELQKRA